MINRAVVVGRLTKDVELRKTQSGISIASFTVACDRPSKKGEEKTADFIRCSAWRQPAEYLSNYAKKGDIVGVDGRIQTGSYERNGITHYTTDIVADQVRILSVKRDPGKQEDPESDYEFDGFDPDDLNF